MDDANIKDVDNGLALKVENLAQALDCQFHSGKDPHWSLIIEFVNALRRLMKQSRTKNVSALRLSEDGKMTLENALAILDMCMMNAQRYDQIQGILVDVLSRVNLSCLTKGNYLRVYAEVFDHLKDKEACDRCYQSITNYDPKDANLLFGWAL